MLQPGEEAPSFTLHSTPDQKVSLEDLRGHPVILVFYPADWSPVCSDELTVYNELIPEFKKYNAQAVGISVDGIWCHTAFALDHKLHIPLLSDFEPKGKIAKAYGVYRAKDGTSERALFVIDEHGIIQWSYLSPEGINPGAEGIFEALHKISKKKHPASR